MCTFLLAAFWDVYFRHIRETFRNMRKDQQLMSKKAIVNQSRNDIMET